MKSPPTHDFRGFSLTDTRTGARPSAVDSVRHAGYRQHARTARSLRSLAASRSSAGGIVTLRQVGSRACPAPSVARVGLRGVSILRVGALLLERGVAGVSRGCFGLGARCARSVLRLLTLRAFPPDPLKPYRACARYARELPTESPRAENVTCSLCSHCSWVPTHTRFHRQRSLRSR